MRFERQQRYGPRSLTDRQRAAYTRKLAKEQARYPLFADHVAAEQRPLDEEIKRREEHATRWESDRRQFLADVWRRARAAYFAQPEEIRSRIRQKWRTWAGPCTATYFASMVDVESGEQGRRLARIEAEFAPVRERIWRQVCAERSSTLDL